MDTSFKNLSFSVNHWHRHATPFASLLPLQFLGFIDHKVDWVRDAFETANFSLILEGGGEFHRLGRRWKVEAPCVITQWPGEYLEYGPSSPHDCWSELYLAYDRRLMPTLRRYGFVKSSRPVWPMANPEGVRSALLELQEFIVSEESPARIDRAAERIILETLLRPARMPAMAPAIAAVLSSVRLHWTEPPDLDHLASLHGMSVSTLRRRWRELVGVSPSRYAMRLRLQKACRHLVESNQPVSAVAATCGFEDEFYFSRCFRRHFGVAPRTYRKEYRLRH